MGLIYIDHTSAVASPVVVHAQAGGVDTETVLPARLVSVRTDLREPAAPIFALRSPRRIEGATVSFTSRHMASPT